MTSYLIELRPSAMALHGVMAPSVISPSVAGKASLTGVCGAAALVDVDAAARQFTAQWLTAGAGGVNGLATKEATTDKPAASGVPPRGRPV